jgi:predicted nucleotidyltransferase
MAIVGLALYGSRARQDGDDGADVDLLAVTTDLKLATTVHGKLTVSIFPLDYLIQLARNGDLFALHIVTEAKVLHEEGTIFERVTRAFTYRRDYNREIKLVSDVGWFLTRNKDRFSDEARFNKRMSWCTRTILIARAANQRRPIFSAKKLSEFSGARDVVALIGSKNSSRTDADMVKQFRSFLRAFGTEEPPVPHTLDEQRSLFEADRNVVGLQVIRAVLK